MKAFPAYLAIFCAIQGLAEVKRPYAGPVPEADDAAAVKFADETLAKMTLEEKLSLCHGNGTMTVTAIPRVGLTEEFWFSDGTHAVRHEIERQGWRAIHPETDLVDATTSFPSLSALTFTWNPRLALRFGEAIGQEARARGKDMMLGPGVNLMRTPLCGRNFEYLGGEDPQLASILVVPVVRGMQANDVSVCVKHFAANNQELDRLRVDTIVDERTLREIYLPAFEASVKDGGALGIMNAYNKLNGFYCSHSDWLNNQVLRRDWGFKGLVISDWGGLHDTIAGALGGTDVEMNGGTGIRHFKQPLTDAVAAGKVPVEVIDAKAWRMLYVQARLKKNKPERTKGSIHTPEIRKTAFDIAAEAVILLKNENAVLPLDPDNMTSLLVVGENAVRKHTHLGWAASSKAPYEITPLEGLQKNLDPNIQISYLPIPKYWGFVSIPAEELMTVDPAADTTGLKKSWKGSYFTNSNLEGTPVEQYDRVLEFYNWKGNPAPGIGPKNFSVRWEAEVKAPESGSYQLRLQFTDSARVFVNDQPIVERWTAGPEEVTTGRVNLEEGKVYTFRVEYSNRGRNPKFAFSWRKPSDKDTTTEELLAAARKADRVVIFTGTRHGHGEAGTENENADRRDMRLPEGEDDAVTLLSGVKDDLVVVNLSGSPMEMPWIDRVKGVVQYGYFGQEGGLALASVLTGRINPSGKLSFTMPKQLKDSPAHALDAYTTGTVTYKEGILMGYRWFDAKNIEPLFPFGFGLSYTTFSLGEPTLSAAKVAPDGLITVSVPVTNTGKRPGAEVVQLYVGDDEASVERPPKELKAFEKVYLRPGETKTVTMTLIPRDFAFWDINAKGWKIEPGTFTLYIGTSSRDLPKRLKISAQ